MSMDSARCEIKDKTLDDGVMSSFLLISLGSSHVEWGPLLVVVATRGRQSSEHVSPLGHDTPVSPSAHLLGRLIYSTWPTLRRTS